jgi:NtrC-family two-component system sensor histidine kinase KinB
MTAREDSDRLNDILVNLLDISRMEAGKAPLALRSLSPRALIVEAAEPFLRMARDQGVSLGLEIGDDLPFVLADPARIGHVFGNLLTNALQHTKPGGSVKLTAQAEDTVVRFIVADTGSGIPAVALPRIFEPFFRVQGGTRQGAGLGLAIAKEIVEAHGGTIEAESREGRGSSFSFTLRRADIIRGQEHLA